MADPSITYLSVPRTARIAHWGDGGPETRYVWLACHGYGQLATYFIRPFACLGQQANLVLAPEGHARFYLEGFSGRVGASWMTREERLMEIDDQRVYLDQVWQELVNPMDGTTRIVLGFSQGVATVARWLAHSSVRPQHIVFWAGTPPPELDFPAIAAFRQATVWMVYGDKDKFIAQADAKKWVGAMEKGGLKVERICFSGGHRLDEEVLLQLKTAIEGYQA